jgi:translation initiation factor 1
MGRNMTSQSTLVYSTERGRICPECGRAQSGCACRKQSQAVPGDGIVRVRREVKGRAGKTVTAIEGVPLRGREIEALASDLKRRCSAGGSVKDGMIVLQGDHRKTVVPLLEEKGFKVKLAGG